jgi:zinc D-Ala-D-Ala carboxypeptidase
VKLSEHFTLAELTRTDHRTLDNNPDAPALANLHRLAAFLEQVREVLGNKVVMITSGYRSAAVNSACGSRESSQHRLGCAADIRVPGMTPDAVVKAVVASGLGYQQLIREFSDPVKGGGWTHISITNEPNAEPKRQALIIDKLGVKPYA